MELVASTARSCTARSASGRSSTGRSSTAAVAARSGTGRSSTATSSARSSTARSSAAPVVTGVAAALWLAAADLRQAALLQQAAQVAALAWLAAARRRTAVSRSRSTASSDRSCTGRSSTAASSARSCTGRSSTATVAARSSTGRGSTAASSARSCTGRSSTAAVAARSSTARSSTATIAASVGTRSCTARSRVTTGVPVEPEQTSVSNARTCNQHQSGGQSRPLHLEISKCSRGSLRWEADWLAVIGLPGSDPHSLRQCVGPPAHLFGLPAGTSASVWGDFRQFRNPEVQRSGQGRFDDCAACNMPGVADPANRAFHIRKTDFNSSCFHKKTCGKLPQTGAARITSLGIQLQTDYSHHLCQDFLDRNRAAPGNDSVLELPVSNRIAISFDARFRLGRITLTECGWTFPGPAFRPKSSAHRISRGIVHETSEGSWFVPPQSSCTSRRSSRDRRGDVLREGEESPGRNH